MPFARIALATLLICGGLMAETPDVTGRWTGTADTTDEAGTKRQEKQTLEIRVENGKLVGNTIGRTGKAGTAFQVQQSGTKVNIYGFLDFEGGEHLRWKFEVKDGTLVGTFSALHDNPAKWIYDRIGAMTATREGSGSGSRTAPE